MNHTFGTFRAVLLTAVITTLSFPAYSQINASLEYERRYQNAFKGQLTVTGLEANHGYVLTINGWKKHSSNERLKEICEVWEPTGEAYCDFDKVSTDGEGKLSANISEELPKGKYKIKFLIKDPGSDWKVVWSDDFVKFVVE